MTGDLHMQEDELELYLRGRIEPSRVSEMDMHLSDCATCREKLSRSLESRVLRANADGIQPVMIERRSERRTDAGDEAVIQEIHPLSLERRTVRMTNFSKNGIGFLTPKFVPPGTIMQVRIGRTIEFGEVRHCLLRGNKEYYVGLRLHHEG